MRIRYCAQKISANCPLPRLAKRALKQLFKVVLTNIFPPSSLSTEYPLECAAIALAIPCSLCRNRLDILPANLYLPLLLSLIGCGTPALFAYLAEPIWVILAIMFMFGISGIIDVIYAAQLQSKV